MKICLARERGKGGGSECENEHCWMFANKEKHIRNVFESDRSWLSLEVIKKPCFSTKDVSKSWAACSTLSTEKRMGHLHISQHQTHSIMHYDPPNSPQTAISSNPLGKPCFCHSEGAKPCQDGMVSEECLKMNIIAEKKLKTLSVTFSGQAVELDLPSPVVKEPNKQVGLAESHQTGATNPK